MSGHTPGPWSITPMAGQAISPRDGFFVSATDAEGAHTDIALVRPCPTHGAGELRANAALIAAAPDLLAALQICDDAFAGWQVGQVPGRPADILALIVKVRQAIAKARGEP